MLVPTVWYHDSILTTGRYTLDKTLSIRGVDEFVARAFSGSAAIRGMTQAEYLKELVDFHKFVRRMEWDLTDGTRTKHGDEEWEGSMFWHVLDMPDEDIVHAIGDYIAERRLTGMTA